MSTLLKWILALVVLLALAFIALYVFIPKQLVVAHAVKVPCTMAGAKRVFHRDTSFAKWWPGPGKTAGQQGLVFSYDGDRYTINNGFLQELDVTIRHDNRDLHSTIYLIPKLLDTVILRWQCLLDAGANPVSRLTQYRQALRIKQNMVPILDSLASFLRKTENIYQCHIEPSIVQDTMLTGTRMNTAKRPSTADVYRLLASLHKYIRDKKAVEIGVPMLHINDNDSTHFTTMVAIPVDRELPEEGPFYPRKLVKGHILKARVQGGPYIIGQAMKGLENFIEDYQKTRMAIPFESMVTDRMLQPDTSRWITDLYYPVMR